MLLSTVGSVYTDELISAKDLNRTSGQVLEKAWDHPVTITRNNQYFALLRRDHMTSLVKKANVTELVFEVTSAAFRLVQNEKIGSEHPYGWLSAFDADELNSFIEEVHTTFRLASGAEDQWEEVEAIVHEWHESALAVTSTTLDLAFQAAPDETPLARCCGDQSED